MQEQSASSSCSSHPASKLLKLMFPRRNRGISLSKHLPGSIICVCYAAKGLFYVIFQLKVFLKIFARKLSIHKFGRIYRDQQNCFQGISFVNSFSHEQLSLAAPDKAYACLQIIKHCKGLYVCMEYGLGGKNIGSLPYDGVP